jgi:HSP20 family protein
MPEPLWHPDRAEGSARRRLDRLMEWEARRGKEWTPNADVIESDENVVVLVDLAGVEPDKLEVLCESDAVIVRGERAPSGRAGEHQTRLECRYGRFDRLIRLPVPVDTAGATAVLENGVLSVTAPRAPGRAGHHVPVVRPLT